MRHWLAHSDEALRSWIGTFTIAPDGRRIAFVGSANGNPVRSYTQPDLWVVDAPGRMPRNLTATYDFDIGGGITGDQRAPRRQHPAAPIWSQGARSILIKAGERGNANLLRLDVGSGGDEDWRTPPRQAGSSLFRALKYLKRPAVMVRFPNENHELSRSGKPWHRVERLQHIVGWFDKWLLGKDAGTYDAAK